MVYEIKQYDDKYLHRMSELFANNFTKLRHRCCIDNRRYLYNPVKDPFCTGQKSPLLPIKFSKGKTIIPMLKNIVDSYPASVIVNNERLYGYMCGITFNDFRGKPAVYVPEWAHSSVIDNRPFIYEKIYTNISKGWVDHGYKTHLIRVNANEKDCIDALFLLGFGVFLIDAIRPCEKLQGEFNPHIRVKKATEDHIDLIIEMTNKLVTHLAKPPCYMPLREVPDRRDILQEMRSNNHVKWIAYYKDEPAGFISSEDFNQTGRADIVNDKSIRCIKDAFVEIHHRGLGIGKSLLNVLLMEAKSNGYKSCSVDFESDNLSARRFWLKYFIPFCISLRKVID